MGYTTNFLGTINLDRKLSDNHKAYLSAFSDSRRMQRNSEALVGYPDPLREAVGLTLGNEGEYFVGSAERKYPEDVHSSILNYNNPPKSQPGLWCQWIPTTCGRGIKWDENEKFYCYTEWLQYILTNFLIPWGYVANGRFDWQGEDKSDTGVIVVRNNVMKVFDCNSVESILK